MLIIEIIFNLFYLKHFFQLNGSVRPVPPPRDHLRIEKDGRLVNRAPAPQVPDRKVTNLQNIAQIIEPTTEQLDSIKKYQVMFILFFIVFFFFWNKIKIEYDLCNNNLR